MHQTLYILWDASHIWGLMLLHTLQDMEVPFRLVKANEIPKVLHSGKLSTAMPAALLVPGGSARLKSEALGKEGRDAIRQYVSQGGQYIGFCGGAGLGLADRGSLRLCPWKRNPYTNRMQHLVSGHILSTIANHPLAPVSSFALPLPVWWPGCFDVQNDGVEILASYDSPGPDLQLADIEIASLPKHIFQQWRDMYDVDMQADFLKGRPCVITGKYGKGRYLLSYSHLETPESSAANAWLAHLLQHMAQITVHKCISGPWHVNPLSTQWPLNTENALLYEAHSGLHRIMELGVAHHVLFKRTSWLYGWRTGIPGSALNSLYMALSAILHRPPNAASLQFWQKHKQHIAQSLPIFLQAVEGYLLTERLATTLAVPLPQAVNRNMLNEQKHMLFGKNMHAWGLYSELIDIFDEMVFLQYTS